jgi:mRNA interferase RelE/StbE
MQYQVIVPKKVQKKLKNIDKGYYKRVLSALIQLEINPFIGKKLKGEYKNQWSLRVWPYRIIYEIADTQLIVLIIKIADRQGVY